MSRSTPRALLAAPLLFAALALSACGDDEDTGANAAPAATGAELASTPAAADASAVPTDPAATTPAGGDAAAATTSGSAPSGDAGDSASGAAGAGGGDAGAAAAGDAGSASPAPDAPAATPAATPKPTNPPRAAPLRPSTERAQNNVLQVLTAVSTCYMTQGDFTKCQKSKVLKDLGAKVVDTKRPKSGQVAVTNASKQSFKIIGTDKQGTRWVLSGKANGDVRRTCKLASGKVCSPATW